MVYYNIFGYTDSDGQVSQVFHASIFQLSYYISIMRGDFFQIVPEINWVEGDDHDVL